MFGFRDQDFIQSNQDNWLDSSKNPTVFVPSVHEVENLLLDFDGLAALDANYNRQARAAGDPLDRAYQLAREALWWMAAKATIADVQERITDGFPKHPKLGIAAMANRSAAQAELDRLLLSSEWGTAIRALVPQLTQSWIADRFAQHEVDLRGHLEDESWRRTWSGKELWKRVVGYMLNSKVSAAIQLDFAKGLAEHQRANSSVDPSMIDLRAALRKRAGLDAW